MIYLTAPLYKDELAYSWFGRCFIRSGSLSYSQYMKEMFCSCKVPSIEFLRELTTEGKVAICKNISVEDLILNHHMDELFTHKDIRFDYDHGVYYPTVEGTRQIIVETEDKTLLHWTINALNRHGYQCLPSNSVCDLHLKAISANELWFTKKGETQMCSSFESLIYLLV